MADLDPLGQFPNSFMAIAAKLGQSRFYSGEGTGSGSGTYPVFVNSTGATDSASVFTVALPGSRVTGNLLILYFKIRSTTNNPTVSAGWTQVDTFGFSSGTFRYGAYWRYVTGSETAPTLTWSGGGQGVAVIAQYTGAHATSPVVVGSKNGAASGSVTTSAITSSRNKSIAVSMIWNDVANAQPTPAGFTDEGTGFYNDVYGSLRLSDAQMATIGTSSGAVSASTVSGQWGSLLFEIVPP